MNNVISTLDLYTANNVEVGLICEGTTLNKFAHNDQTFVEAPEKGKYIIRLRNNSSVRKLVVISVDGRNVLDGETAGYDGQGYVLNPYQSYDIKGWRRTADEVAAFEFVDLASSYDKLMGGSGSNVGVIGVAVFEEKVPAWTYWEKKTVPLLPVKEVDYWWSNDNGTTAPYQKHLGGSFTASNSLRTKSRTDPGLRVIENSSLVAENYSFNAEVKNIGTGYGEKTEMKTTSTTFEKLSSVPSQVITLRYATLPTLKKWGVVVEPVIPSVNPFPKENAAVKSPPGWKG